MQSGPVDLLRPNRFLIFSPMWRSHSKNWGTHWIGFWSNCRDEEGSRRDHPFETEQMRIYGVQSSEGITSTVQICRVVGHNVSSQKHGEQVAAWLAKKRQGLI
jgi:hypothetical protein